MLSKEDYQALYEYVTTITPEYTREQLAEKAANYLYTALGAESVIVTIEDSTKTRYGNLRGPKLAKDLETQAIGLKTPISILNISRDFLLSKNKEAAGYTSSAYCAPLLHQGRAFGAITIFTQHPLKERTTFIQEFCNQTLRTHLLRKTLEGAHTTAVTDQLTGLSTKAYFQEIINVELERASRQEDSTTLLLYDLDDFKKYNDTRGHIAGDDLLQRLGRHIRTALPLGIHCRYGGEEFAALLTKTPQGTAKECAEHLRTTVEQTFTGETTLSIGIITVLNSSLPSITMLKEADKALYEAKSKGKNRTVQYICVDKGLGIINTEHL